MPRVPQILITLTPSDELVAELPGPNGSRRQIPIPDLFTIRRLLAAQRRHTADSIGTDAAPTSAQVIHWRDHLSKGTHCADDECLWCMAQSLGVDTSEAAFYRAKRDLLAARATNKTNYRQYTIGDGTVKVRHFPTKSKKIGPKHIDMSELFSNEE